MDRAELILRMAENKVEEGKEISDQINARGAAYLADVRGLLTMAREAVAMLERREQEFAHFGPNKRVAHTNQPAAITEMRRPTPGEQKDGRAAAQ